MTSRNFFHILGVASGQAAPGGGGDPKLVAVNINKGVAGAVVNVYNGTTAAGQLVASIDGATPRSHWYGGIRCPNGIFVDVTVAAADVTVSFE